MNADRWFIWVRDEALSSDLQHRGARVCEGSVETHHAEYAILHEIPAHVALELLPEKGRGRA